MERKPDVKPCEACGAWMTRKMCGEQRESRVRFWARRTCDRTCSGTLKAKVSKRYCIQCEQLLARRYFRCGAIESRQTFLRRKWCGEACRAVWMSYPENERAYVRAVGAAREAGKRKAKRG